MPGATSADDDRSASDRLVGLGLGPRPSGWVPEQPRVHGQPDPADPAVPTSASPAAASDVGEALRTAVASRLPLWAAGRVERATPGSILTVLVTVVAVVVIGVVYLHRHAGPTSTYSSSAYSNAPSGGTDAVTGTGAPAPPATTTDSQSIVIDVGGRVRKPGLVTLPLGARVADAIDAAGGPLHPHELDRIDLAQRVSDGQLLLIGVNAGAGDLGAGATASPGVGTADAPVSLSTATLEGLETLPGVGPVTAQKIIDWRSAHGGFTSVEQLQQISGIGPAHYAEISPLVTP